MMLEIESLGTWMFFSNVSRSVARIDANGQPCSSHAPTRTVTLIAHVNRLDHPMTRKRCQGNATTLLSVQIPNVVRVVFIELVDRDRATEVLLEKLQSTLHAQTDSLMLNHETERHS